MHKLYCFCEYITMLSNMLNTISFISIQKKEGLINQTFFFCIRYVVSNARYKPYIISGSYHLTLCVK